MCLTQDERIAFITSAIILNFYVFIRHILNDQISENRPKQMQRNLKVVPDFPHPSFPPSNSSSLQQLPLTPLQFVICPLLQATEELEQILLPAASLLMPFEAPLRKVEPLTRMLNFC